MSDLWASDVTISTPEPFDQAQPPLLDFGGLAFTAGGMAHNLTEADHEEWFTPPLSPQGTIPIA